MWVLLFILFIVFILSRDKQENFSPAMEGMPFIKPNNIQIEQFHSSHLRDLNFNVEPDEEREIKDVYDSMVDDGRLVAQKFDTLETVDANEYYQFDKKESYGFTNFPSY